MTAAYNLINSAAALAGAYAILDSMPSALPIWLIAVGAGGTIGAIAGSRYLPDTALRYILALVLFIAGAKLILT
ncbi:hypothetical protein [Mesorhizobium australicum]|uniref:hypothetical protein n=1 Tax=Mesorhizobium australicum TaxID=536018 RepID=UPI000A1CB6B5|nr:hypothetical protein [Mesorhizobium australicum]